MKYFVRIDNSIIVVSSLKRAEEVAKSYVDDNEVEYIDYGVVNFDNWEGNSVIAVLKNLSGREEVINDITTE